MALRARIGGDVDDNLDGRERRVTRDADSWGITKRCFVSAGPGIA